MVGRGGGWVEKEVGGKSEGLDQGEEGATGRQEKLM